MTYRMSTKEAPFTPVFGQNHAGEGTPPGGVDNKQPSHEELMRKIRKHITGSEEIPKGLGAIISAYQGSSN